MKTLRIIDYRELFGFLAASTGVGLLTSLLLALLVMLLQPGSAQAGELEGPPDAMQVGLQDIGRGSLLWPGDGPGRYRLAPLLDTGVDMHISGMTARVTVTQRFRNTGDNWLEGRYVFPLPENAAVDRLEMRIGSRLIKGVIKERAEAKKIYQQAKQSGRKAALVEQQRPNLFTNSVANVGPGEEVVVRIGYLQTLRYDQGRFRIRFPMVVGPRYIPGKPINMSLPALHGGGWAVDTDQVPDASRITPPVALPEEGLPHQHSALPEEGQPHQQGALPKAGPINPISLRAELSAGFPLAALRSPSHPVEVRETDNGTRLITLKGDHYADRDFELVWQPERGQAPRGALFAEHQDGEDYGLLMLLPPGAEHVAGQRTPRESIFVIDTSGSMSGTSMPQAKAGLLLALQRLQPGDSFNVIQFNSATESLFPQAQPVNRQTLAAASRYVRGLQANGGTEMAAALHAALANQQENQRVRQVVFLTDGSVGNEDALFRIIHDELGRSRLFTVGIGSAPNSHFMTRAAKFGRGTFTYIGNLQEVQEKMQGLFEKLENPVLTGIRVQWPDGQQAEAWPERIPDLYAGEPLLMHVRLAQLNGDVTLSGKLGGRDWRTTLPVSADPARSDSGIAALWARSKIASLMERLQRGGDAGEVRDAVLAVALKHQLVSKYTSLVAVDVTPSRPADQQLLGTNLPTNLPAGWQYNKVFGMPQTATAASLHLALGLLAMLLAALLAFGPRLPLPGRAA